jgi:hypothetical protein
MSRAARLVGLVLLLLNGCLPLDLFHADSDLAQVATSPFPPTVVQTVQRARPNYAPADATIGMSVDAVGRRLLAANPQLAIKPAFATIGAPTAEVFHPDANVIYVTEGLVNQCRSEADLAAVLANELGKMVSEREAAASRQARVSQPSPPIELPIGSPGQPLAADPSHFLEMARFEQAHPRSARNKQVPPPDPHTIAGYLLEQAGFQKTDLDDATPILRAADQNNSFERQFKGVITTPDGRPWQPR